MKKSCSGSISLYCSMIFLFILAFLGSLLWLSKQQIMKTGIRSDLDAAGFSVLAEYEKDWVQEYGLYVIPKEQIEDDMVFYMKENQNHSWGDYQIDELTVTQCESLQDIAVLQEQILMFMNERGLYDFIEEVGTSVLQIKDLDQQVEKEVNWKESSELLLIQQLYGELVTIFEGIRNDGNREFYSINYLLDEKPALSEVLKALETDTPTSKQLGVLEQAYDELNHVAILCEEALMIGSELEKAIEELENPQELPVTVEELRRYRNIIRKNKVMCEEASQAIQKWIQKIVEADEEAQKLRAEAVISAQKLKEFDRSIKLPYEYKESESKWDFSAILSSLKGYPFDIGEIAPDEELDLGFEEEQEKEELDLECVSVGDSFGDQFLVTEYVLGVFQNFREAAAAKKGEKSLNLRGEEKQGRFFNNEVEYLLIGRSNEYKNVNGTRNYILSLRSVLNMVHLLTDSEKRAEIEALAGMIGGILLPGIGNGIFFGIILTAWSLGEAIVDYQVLVEGGKIPLLKNKESWRVDLAAILSLDIPDAEDNSGEGMNYKQYLRVMLYTVDQAKLLTRIQNILVLNNQKQGLAEAVTHFVVEGKANGGFSTFAFSGEYGYGME